MITDQKWNCVDIFWKYQQSSLQYCLIREGIWSKKLQCSVLSPSSSINEALLRRFNNIVKYIVF